MDYEKLIEGLTYVRDVLNTTPITGVDNCQKVINAVVNINITINQLQQAKNVEEEMKIERLPK